jgi:nicotinamidase-related amidase
MIINPANTALLAMDFQGVILATLASTDDLVDRTATAIAALRRANAKVAFVRVAFTAEEMAGFPAHSAMGQRMNEWADKVMADACSTQVDARLAPHPGDIVVRKIRVGPFSTTNLDEQLRAAGVETLIVCGIHTSGCVLTGVREAHDLDYRVIVVRDCCADPDPGVHEFLTGTIFPKQADVVDLADLLAALGAPVDAGARRA